MFLLHFSSKYFKISILLFFSLGPWVIQRQCLNEWSLSLFCFWWILTSVSFHAVPLKFMAPGELNPFNDLWTLVVISSTKPVLFTGNTTALVLFWWTPFTISVFSYSFSSNFFICLCFRGVSNIQQYLDFWFCYLSPKSFSFSSTMCVCIQHMYVTLNISLPLAPIAVSLWTTSLDVHCSKPFCSLFKAWYFRFMSCVSRGLLGSHLASQALQLLNYYGLQRASSSCATNLSISKLRKVLDVYYFMC